MLHLRALAALTLFLSGTAVARDRQDPPATQIITLDPADIIAFAEYEQRMRVPVRVDGAGPFQFVIDTGAERTVISRQVATRLGLAPGRTVTIAAMTGVVPVPTARIPSLQIDALRGTAPIEAPQLEGLHLGADGLVGLDSLADHSLLIDFDASEMHVRKSRRRDRGGRPGEIVVTAKSLLGRLVVTDARFAGKRISVVLDTGTSTSIGNLALLKLVAAKAKSVIPIQLISVTGGQIIADYRIVPRMTLGDVELNSIPVAFSDTPPFKRLGLDDEPALFLGMDALKLFRQVSIDFANREVRFMLPRSVRMAGLNARIMN